MYYCHSNVHIYKRESLDTNWIENTCLHACCWISSLTRFLRKKAEEEKPILSVFVRTFFLSTQSLLFVGMILNPTFTLLLTNLIQFSFYHLSARRLHSSLFLSFGDETEKRTRREGKEKRSGKKRKNKLSQRGRLSFSFASPSSCAVSSLSLSLSSTHYPRQRLQGPRSLPFKPLTSLHIQHSA